ncbi:MAG: PD-(D/E)XK nuclease family protein [Verrucomicrobiales bacterium]|nr:PD-(D/E)XK nuclease family protein [Verrucomicrobiales bacterium]MCP5556429.1 PD-(D/E)XK nuclease family protein [Verrucomicrobiaceae bacterium]
MNEALESMLVELRQIVSPPRVRTLFGVGGRGYYENPASDLLAFFMRPDEVHELESLFLEAFLECAGKKADGYAMEGVMVEREVDVPAGGRIDLLVRGPGWVLVIENKVYHHQANPFKNYQDYAAELLKGIAPVLVVLSPDGQTDQKGWVGVSYQSYCQSLRRRLDSLELALSTSKWVLFAREWILHLELELYTSPMTTEQIAFADQHLKELEQAKRLHADYRAFLMDRLPRLLGEAVPGETFHASDHGWAIRSAGQSWGRSDLAFWYEDRPHEKLHQITVYLVEPSEAQCAAAQEELRDRSKMKYSPGRSYKMWVTVDGFPNREAAEQEWMRLGLFVAGLYPKIEPPSNETADARLVS